MYFTIKDNLTLILHGFFSNVVISSIFYKINNDRCSCFIFYFILLRLFTLHNFFNMPKVNNKQNNKSPENAILSLRLKRKKFA